MTNRELMQQALDALLYHTEQTRPITRTAAAIAALRERLASWDALERMADNARELGLDYDEPRRS